MHRATNRFWKCFNKLPSHIRKIARKNFQLLKTNPRHPSLHFKKIGKFWSVRAGLNLRSLAVEDDNDYIWVWIGIHNDYEKIIKEKD
ncbi:MAG: hypothetical protein ISS16_05555 [Ignavibacteria bacterium]|nr:hypothetical protein [Ignavibacteria bacterium]